MIKNNIHGIIIATVMIFYSCSIKKENLQLNGYPSFKLGFTTQNFMQSYPVGMGNALKLIDYAASNGFSWVELRDPDAVLTSEECQQIAGYAKRKAVEIAYAIHRGLLDDDFWEVFHKGVKNAVAFKNNGPNTLRAPACGNEFNTDSGKVGWNREEFSRLVANAVKASEIASDAGLRLVLENGVEAINGKDAAYYGLDDLLSSASTVGLQFDTANPFSVSRVLHEAADVEAFLERYAQRLAYIHLKSAAGGEALPVLTDNPLHFQNVFEIMSHAGTNYVAIELAGAYTEREVIDHLEKSMAYLRQKY